jgi:hypothetical protein
MRVVRPTLKIFLSEMDKLDEEGKKLREAADAWIKELDHRDNGWGNDQYYISILRDKLEASVVSYRKQLAAIYDYGGDKGLV